jgi:glycosyltransferase involved in cell wall biosynthesis
MRTTPSNSNLLFLSTTCDSFTSHSGYQLLANYFPGSQMISAPLRDPGNFLTRNAARIARRFSFSRWYQVSSARLEWQALCRIRRGFHGVVHCMWADNDWGFLDLLISKDVSLCGSFHHCSDTIAHVIRHPHRLRRFNAAILMSQTQRPIFLEAGVPADRIHVVLHGVDCDYFKPAASRSTDGFRVLAVGGYSRNFPVLQKVATALAGHRRIHFDIVAPRHYAPLFAAKPNVSFYSNISDADLLSLNQQASVFLLTVENATANNALLEAMACATPVIGERVGGVPEYVDASSGILVTPASVAEMVGAIRQLASSSALGADLGAGALQRARSLDWPKVAERMRHIYASIQL